MAHTLTNTTLNLLHTVTPDGMDGGISLRMTAYSMVALLGMLLVRYLAKRNSLFEAQPWETGMNGSSSKKEQIEQ